MTTEGVFMCLCVQMCVRGGVGYLCLNQVWHPHMSENNGILYVFEHVSFSQQVQMESEGCCRRRRRTGMGIR